MFLPLGGVVLASFAAIIAVAVIARGRNNSRGVLALTVLLIIGWGAAVSGVFFGVLDNCSLSCGTTIRSVTKSPTGQWTAVWFTSDCVSLARYCPPVSHLSIVKRADSVMGTKGNVLSIKGDYLQLYWESGERLRVDYSGDRIIRKRSSFEDVQVIYRVVGTL